ncbi:MAG: TetR family transcriptional regulator, partial [Pseudomonadota bacterium]
MTDTETQVLDATILAVSQLGMRKTSMSDIAMRADVSRQTVYNLFGTKDGIFHAAIVHMGEQWRKSARARLKTRDNLSEQLDVLIKVFAVDAYTFSHASSASTDMFFEARLSAPKAIEQFVAENRKLFREVFEPYITDR